MPQKKLKGITGRRLRRPCTCMQHTSMRRRKSTLLVCSIESLVPVTAAERDEGTIDADLRIRKAGHGVGVLAPLRGLIKRSGGLDEDDREGGVVLVLDDDLIGDDLRGVH
jgi:hypothetical protein